ncbi:Calx-beta domain-containing protein, partial [Chromatium okenii]|uniref:beta strand repeat-containing protein n=1 Tax=Chromatium okenii TaxID=61644 RepID=UPI0026F1FA1D
MAKIYLETTDTTFTLSNAATVYGAAGDQKVIVNEGVTGVTFDQLVERVDLPGSFASFKYQQAGNGLQVYSGTTLLATIPLQADGTQIVTSGGSVMASLAAGVMTLGGSTVSDAAAGAVTPSAAAITTAVTTGSTFVPVPTFSISTATSTSAFEGTSATYTVLLNTPQATASTVKLVATPSTGAVAADLGTMTVTGATLAADGTLTFAPGAVAATVTLPIGFDSLTETGESVTLALSNPSTGMALGASSVTTTLTDPAPPTFKLTSNAVAGTPTQEGNTINFTVTPSGVVVSPTTMTINVVGNDSSPLTNATAPDFNPSSTTVTFAAGETAPKTVSITVATDTMSEGLEDYAATLYDGSFLPITGAVVTGTINDPVPALTLAADKTAVDEGGSVVYTVTSTLAAPTVGITVPYTLAGSAVAGTDHTGTATGTITIAAGSKTGSVTVNTIADNATDGTDTLIMTLGTPSNGTITTGSATTTIADTSLSLGAAEIALSGAASVDEGGDLVYTVTRGSAVATGSTLTIPYTLTGNAANGTDYTGSAPTGNFVMAAGTSSASVTLKVTADSLTEATAENIIMTLGALPTGTTAAAGRGTP